MKLLTTLIKRAGIATPVSDAKAYLLSRATDNTELGDITMLPYAGVSRVGNKWLVDGKTGEGKRVFGTEAEARADILRRFW